MSTSVVIALVILLIASGYIGCILPLLPGPPLAYATMLLLHFTNTLLFTTTELIVWGVVMVVVTLIDYFLSPYMTLKFGGSKAGAWGAIVGVFAGILIPVPIIGSMIGAFIGAFLTELLITKVDTPIALKAATGTFIAFILGTGLKLIYCLAITILLLTHLL